MLKFSVIFSSFYNIRTIFPGDQVSNASHVNQRKTLGIKGMQHESKHVDPIFLLHFLNVPSCA